MVASACRVKLETMGAQVDAAKLAFEERLRALTAQARVACWRLTLDDFFVCCKSQHIKSIFMRVLRTLCIKYSSVVSFLFSISFCFMFFQLSLTFSFCFSLFFSPSLPFTAHTPHAPLSLLLPPPRLLLHQSKSSETDLLARIDALRAAHAKELEAAVRDGNQRYSDMLAARMSREDELTGVCLCVRARIYYFLFPLLSFSPYFFVTSHSTTHSKIFLSTSNLSHIHSRSLIDNSTFTSL
jgi:hypothetical protein